MFASATLPGLLRTHADPDGPFDPAAVAGQRHALQDSREDFFPVFVRDCYTAAGEMTVPARVVHETVNLCLQSDEHAGLDCFDTACSTGFRDDLANVSVPALVIHGDQDEVAAYAGTGQRTHDGIPGCGLVLIGGGPHSVQVSHRTEWNEAVLEFLTT